MPICRRSQRNIASSRLAGVAVLCMAALPVLAHAASGDPRADLPARKAGLWEVTVQAHASGGAMRQPAQTVRQCTDVPAERVMLLSIVPGQEQCRRFTVTRIAESGGYDITGICSVHDQRVVVSAQLRGDLQSVYSGSYRVEHAAAVPMGNGPVDFQGRWLGQCGPGQRPGDMVLPNGIKVNVVDDIGRAEAHAH